MRYLLGTLSEDEKTRLEEEFFLEDAEFEQLEIAEDELIDRYVRTELSPEETRQFEKLLISPRLSQRVEIARLLAHRAASRPQKQPVTQTPPILRPEPPRVSWWDRLFGPAAVATPAFRPAMAVAVTLMLLTTVALIFVWSKLRAESLRLAQEQQQREQLQREIENEKERYAQLDQQLQQTRQEKEEQQQQFAEKYEQLLAEQQRSAPALAFSFPIFLSPGSGTRSSGGGAPTSELPRGARSVGINLNVTHGDYPSYNALVRHIDSGKEITKRTNLKPVPRRGKKYITINVDANQLPAGSYNVRVNGVTPTGEENFDDYPFRVRAVSR